MEEELIKLPSFAITIVGKYLLDIAEICEHNGLGGDMPSSKIRCCIRWNQYLLEDTLPWTNSEKEKAASTKC